MPGKREYHPHAGSRWHTRDPFVVIQGCTGANSMIAGTLQSSECDCVPLNVLNVRHRYQSRLCLNGNDYVARLDWIQRLSVRPVEENLPYCSLPEAQLHLSFWLGAIQKSSPQRRGETELKGWLIRACVVQVQVETSIGVAPTEI
jgi:hypothetical protein